MGEVETHLMTQPPRRRFIIPEVIPAAGSTMLYGASNAGKTGIAIRTAMSVAAGLDWGERRVERAAVVYAACEDPKGVQERLLACARYLSLDAAELPILVVNIHAAGLVTADGRDQLQSDAEEVQSRFDLPIGLIIVDTVSAAFGDKNQDDAQFAGNFMANVNSLAAELDCGVLCIHHPGKMAGDAMRGSGEFYNRADAVIQAARTAGQVTTLRFRKQRNWSDDDSFEVRIDGFDLDIFDATINVQIVQSIRPIGGTDGKVTSDRRVTTNEVARRVLFELARDGHVTLKIWQQACFAEWSDKDAGARKTAFSRALSKLISEGTIVVDRDDVTVTSHRNHVTADVTNPQLPVTLHPPLSKRGDGNGVTGGNRGVTDKPPNLPRPMPSESDERRRGATRRSGTEG